MDIRTDNVKIDFDVNKIAKVKELFFKKKQVLFEEKIIEDSNFFVPVRDHYLEESVIEDWAGHKGEGFLKWNTPYAKNLYNGDDYNFSKDQNPNSRAKWFEEAKKIHKDDWIKELK